jgi:muramidase (phage lysozyme)
MLSPALTNLLAAIRKHEAPKGYGQIYGGAKGVSKSTDVSIMTLKGVQDLQAKMVKAGSASTACGGYQFIRKTLALTIAEMGLTGKEIWTPALQDRMAVHLLEKRGLSKFLAGKISRETFANNLAMEWASLPVVTPINGKRVGQSYYAGDGLNKSHHKPAAILALVDALKAAPTPARPAPTPVPAEEPVAEPSPPTPATEPRKGFWARLKSWFT